MASSAATTAASTTSSTTSSAIASFKVTGLCCAPFTAFNKDMSVNYDMVPQYVDQLKRSGVDYAFVAGTTGEGLKMTVEERKKLLEVWIAAGAKFDLTVIAHTGAERLSETVELTKHAQEAGAAAVGVMPPTFFKPASLEALVEWLKEAAAAAPELPFYYYHIPPMTNVTFRMDHLLDAVHGVIPNFRGIKYTDYNLYVFQNCINHVGNYDMLYGRDEQLLAAVAMGAKGAVGSTYNYMAPVYTSLITAFNAGRLEDARKSQAESARLVNLLAAGDKYGKGVYVNKEIMSLITGTDFGPARAPSLPMTPAARKELHEDLKKIGVMK